MKIAGVIAMGLIMTLAICLTASSVEQVALRSQAANLGMSEYTWTDSNFAGFYYDIDKNIGTEQLTFRLSDITPDRAILSDRPDAYGLRGIVYTTQALPKNFKFRPWGQYEIIGFLSDGYFAAYDNTITSGMQAAGEDVAYLYDESKTNNLLNNEQISRVLIDDDTEQAITSDHPLKLSEGYQLAIKSLDVTTNKADLELSRNGQVIDNKVVQPSIPNSKMSDKTYYYKVNFGDTKDIVQLAVHFKNAFKNGTVNVATVDGIFQISDNFEQIKIDRTYDNMSIRMVNPTNMTIILDNKDHQITLSKNKDILLMEDIHIRTTDQEDISAENPLRYYIYETTTIGNLTKQILNQPPVITSFVSSRGNNTLTGEPVIFTAMVSDPDINDQILYRFFLNGEPVTDWFSQSQWTWTPGTSEVVNNQVEVRVIDQNHAERDSLDAKKDLEIRVESNQALSNSQPFNQSPVISNFITSKGSRTIVPGDSVVLTATASDLDNADRIFYRFFLNGIPVTDWGLDDHWTWNTTDSDVGNNQIEVRVIDKKHSGLDSFDDKKLLSLEILNPMKKSVIDLRLFLIFILFLLLILVSILYVDEVDTTIPEGLKTKLEILFSIILTLVINVLGLESWEGLILVWVSSFLGIRILMDYILEKSIILLIKFLASKPIFGSIFTFIELVLIPNISNIQNKIMHFMGYQFEISNVTSILVIMITSAINILMSNKIQSFYDYILDRSRFSEKVKRSILIIFVIILSIGQAPTILPSTILPPSSYQNDQSHPHHLVGLEYDALSLPGTVLVTALAEDPNNVHIIYRFYLNEEPETKWVHENKFVLNIIDKNINKIKIGVRVKDDRNTNEDEFDDSMNRTCSIGK